MTILDKVRFATQEIKPNIGSRVLADKSVLLSGDHAPDIMGLLEQRGVLVFPEIHFSDDEHVSFTHTLGKFARENGADIYRVTLDAAQNDTAEYLKAAFFWHFDGFSSPVPIRASLAASKVLSPTGGNTEFCSTYAAYEALSAEDKQFLAPLKAVHALASTQLDLNPQPTYEKWQEWATRGRRELPLVWTHRSGRKSLVIGNSAHHVVGMDPLEGKGLLVRLRDWATRPEFTYSHVWKVGDLVMWDNTGTLHRAMPYPLDSGRMLHRTKLEGEEPIAA
jgi:alpha-ketoglutarate-dependent taurine dioxygenase